MALVVTPIYKGMDRNHHRSFCVGGFSYLFKDKDGVCAKVKNALCANLVVSRGNDNGVNPWLWARACRLIPFG